MSKCIFCDKKLENKTSGDQECSVFLECPECGNYGLHPEFERIAINDPESFQKWLSQNQLAILEIIRDCNLDGHPCLLEKNIYDRHNFYPSENRIIPT